MQSLKCVELFLFVLWPKMSVPDIKNLGLQCNAVITLYNLLLSLTRALPVG